MGKFIDTRPEGNPKHYAIALRYAFDGTRRNAFWVWYCGLSHTGMYPRHVVFSRQLDSKRIKRYINPQTAEKKIVLDAFTDPRVSCACIVPLDPSRKPVLSVLNINFGRRVTENDL